MRGELLDTVRAIETPEGVELAVHVAGPVPRGLAWLLDGLMRSMVYAGLSIPLGLLGDTGMGLFMIVLFFGEWFYPVLFEVMARGQTPGKMVVGLAVVNDDGTPVDWSASVLRNLLRFADFMPMMYGFGLTSMMLSRDFKRLGDLAANTLVVHRPRALKERPLVEAPAVPSPVPLQLAEQRAVIDFSARSNTWTQDRGQELAGHLRPLTGQHGEPAVATLHGMARWLSGRR